MIDWQDSAEREEWEREQEIAAYFKTNTNDAAAEVVRLRALLVWSVDTLDAVGAIFAAKRLRAALQVKAPE